MPCSFKEQASSLLLSSTFLCCLLTATREAVLPCVCTLSVDLTRYCVQAVTEERENLVAEHAAASATASHEHDAALRSAAATLAETQASLYYGCSPSWSIKGNRSVHSGVVVRVSADIFWHLQREACRAWSEHAAANMRQRHKRSRTEVCRCAC